PILKSKDISLGDCIGGGSYGIQIEAQIKGKTIVLTFHRCLTREALLITREISLIEHKNITKIFLVEDRLRIAIMESSSTDLMDFIRLKAERGRLIDLKTLRVIAKQLMEGIDFMHERGIAHNNITLENVLIDRCPQKGYLLVKVTNFDNSKKCF